MALKGGAKYAEKSLSDKVWWGSLQNFKNNCVSYIWYWGT